MNKESDRAAAHRGILIKTPVGEEGVGRGLADATSPQIQLNTTIYFPRGF